MFTKSRYRLCPAVSRAIYPGMTTTTPELKRTAALLTAGGVLPFIGLVVGMALLDPPTNSTAALWLASYATAILGFLGGIRWGMASVAASGRPVSLILSVLPSLAGFALLPLYITSFSQSPRVFLGFALLFAVQFGWDWISAAVPAWFKPMRLWASLIAISSLVAAWAVASFPML